MDTTRVLIAGGGVAALEAALALHALAQERVQLTLLAPEPELVYRPAQVAEPFGRSTVRHFGLAELAGEFGAGVIRGALSGVDPQARIAWADDGSLLGYDALVIACGARPGEAVRGALTFAGEGADVRGLLAELQSGSVRRVVFAVPAGAGWPLPAYELALLTAAHLATREARERITLALVTPEPQPLPAFGREPGEAVERLLAEAGIELHTHRTPISFAAGVLRLAPEGSIGADRVVALPRLRGEPITGIPHDGDGFIRTDRHGRVDGLDGVYAAGDVTAFPVKQGGLATQQADAVAEAIAAACGVEIEPAPFTPVLRGMLLTGGEPLIIRNEPIGGAGDRSTVSRQPLWWPPSKIAGRHLAPFLAAHDLEIRPPPDGALAVEHTLTG